MKKSILVDMDETIVNNRFPTFLEEFLKKVDYTKLKSFNRQDLIKGRENEFKKKYKFNNLYKNEEGSFIEPLNDCIKVLKRLNEKYEVFIVTSYKWKEDIFDPANNLKNKYEYLENYFPFLNSNNFIFIDDKTLIHFDIGIDDNPRNLVNCDLKLLMTERRNKNISDEELKKQNIVRVNDWNEIYNLLR